MAAPQILDSKADVQEPGAYIAYVDVVLDGGAPDAGDILVAFAHTPDGTDLLTDPIADWDNSQIYGSTSSNGGYIVTKVADGSETDTFHFSTHSLTDKKIQAAVWRLDSGDLDNMLFGEDLPNSPPGAYIPVPGITTVTANNLLICQVWETWEVNYIQPSGWTKAPTNVGNQKAQVASVDQVVTGLVDEDWEQTPGLAWSNGGGTAMVAIPPSTSGSSILPSVISNYYIVNGS